MIEEVLKQASAEDKKVFIHYRKGNGELSERVIGGIIPSEEYGDGYIEAFCYKQNDKRTFRIDRILTRFRTHKVECRSSDKHSTSASYRNYYASYTQ